MRTTFALLSLVALLAAPAHAATPAASCPAAPSPWLLVQDFDSLPPGTPALNAERDFRKAFCPPVRYFAGFGNDAEPPIASLKPKARDDRLARESKGQYNGASSVVRLSVVGAPFARSGQALRVLYPQGTNTSSHSGTQFDLLLPGAKVQDRSTGAITGTNSYQDLRMSYWVRMDANFDFAFGGKLPGLAGARAYGGETRDTEISSRLMWREDGRLEFYLHTEHDARERLLWNNVPGRGHAALRKGQWHFIEFRMAMNRVGAANGVLQGWLDGVLVADYRDLQFRKDSAVGWNTVFFSTFHGGSSGRGGPGEIWWPSRDVYATFDELRVRQHSP